MNKNRMSKWKWIGNHEVENSAKTMWCALMGVEPNQVAVPHSVAEFARCYKLVEFCKITYNDLEIIGNKYKEWRIFARNFFYLVSLYQQGDKKLLKVFINDFLERNRKI